MQKLGERLQVMAERTIDSKTVADIGSDHGFLPLYLIKNNLCNKVIITDISESSLEKGRVNCREAFVDAGIMQNDDFSDRLSFRLGNGLKVLKNGEADTVVIGGMGGKLICEILDSDLEHTFSFGKFVFQPRIGQGHLRKWLSERGFGIIREDVVKEGRFLPEIITAVSPGNKNDFEYLNSETDLSLLSGDDIICKVPPWLIKAGGAVDLLVKQSICREKEILAGLEQAKNSQDRRIFVTEGNIRYLQKLLGEIQYGK